MTLDDKVYGNHNLAYQAFVAMGLRKSAIPARQKLVSKNVPMLATGTVVVHHIPDALTIIRREPTVKPAATHPRTRHPAQHPSSGEFTPGDTADLELGKWPWIFGRRRRLRSRTDREPDTGWPHSGIRLPAVKNQQWRNTA